MARKPKGKKRLPKIKSNMEEALSGGNDHHYRSRILSASDWGEEVQEFCKATSPLYENLEDQLDSIREKFDYHFRQVVCRGGGLMLVVSYGRTGTQFGTVAYNYIWKNFEEKSAYIAKLGHAAENATESRGVYTIMGPVELHRPDQVVRHWLGYTDLHATLAEDVKVYEVDAYGVIEIGEIKPSKIKIKLLNKQLPTIFPMAKEDVEKYLYNT